MFCGGDVVSEQVMVVVVRPEWLVVVMEAVVAEQMMVVRPE